MDISITDATAPTPPVSSTPSRTPARTLARTPARTPTPTPPRNRTERNRSGRPLFVQPTPPTPVRDDVAPTTAGDVAVMKNYLVKVRK